MKAQVQRLHFDYFGKAFLTVCTVLLSIGAFAQDTKQVDVNINANGGGGFLGSPWIWVVGIAVFVLLLVALLRGNGRRTDV